MTLDDFTPHALGDETALALAERIRYEADATRESTGPDVLRGTVELTLQDGAQKAVIDAWVEQVMTIAHAPAAGELARSLSSQ